MIGLAGACTSKSVMLDERTLVASAGSRQDVMYGPISLEEAQQVLPFTFQTPSSLPYTPRYVPVIIRKSEGSGRQKLVLNVKYLEEKEKKTAYIELTVANFDYNMSSIKEYKQFDEMISLTDSTKAYLRDEQEKSQRLLSLTWNRKGMDYQLLYRYGEDKNAADVRNELLQVANQMKKA
jgi:hypothetical protein